MGRTISRAECDGCLRDLALILPRAGMRPEDVDRMLDLYFGLLAPRGVTRKMLAQACEHIAMKPAKDGKKFFPDPGQLFEPCREAAHDRKVALQALERAQAIADGMIAATPEEPPRRTGPRAIGDIPPPGDFKAVVKILDAAAPPREPQVPAASDEVMTDERRAELHALSRTQFLKSRNGSGQ